MTNLLRRSSQRTKNESHEVGLDFLCAEQMLWMTHVLALIIYMDLYIIWSKDGHSHFVSGPKRGFVKATNGWSFIHYPSPLNKSHRPLQG